MFQATCDNAFMVFLKHENTQTSQNLIFFCRFMYFLKLHTYDSFTFLLETWPETF